MPEYGDVEETELQLQGELRQQRAGQRLEGGEEREAALVVAFQCGQELAKP